MKFSKRKSTGQLKLRNRIISSLLVISLLGGQFVMLPSAAAEMTAFCGFEEHSHSDTCWQTTDTLVCDIEEGHNHGEKCRESESSLICQITEQVHEHSEECYSVAEAVTCTEHEHTAECWSEESTLNCEEDHEHEDTCFTLTQTAVCQHSESTHVHSEGCRAAESVLICDFHQHGDDCFETAQVLVCTVPENHTHDESCRTSATVFVCSLPEHSHTLACYSDATADTETAADWEATLPQVLTGSQGDDLLASARSQLGYTESSRNYLVAQDGETRMGYNRYGAWYADYTQDPDQAYLDWNITFLFFCISHSGIQDLPLEETCPEWIDSLDFYELYHSAAEGYTPDPGDLVFLDSDGNGEADRAGVVSVFDAEHLAAIEGDVAGAVAEVTYETADPRILGYAEMSQAEEVPDEETPDLMDYATFRIYFAAPSSWTSYTIYANGCQSNNENLWAQTKMTNTGNTYSQNNTTYYIYYADVTTKYDGFDVLQFQKYSGTNWQEEYPVASSWITKSEIEDKLWVPNSTNVNSGGKWISFRSVYYDATLSKLSYWGSSDDYGIDTIPRANDKEYGSVVYCHYWNNESNISGDVLLGKLASHTSGSHTWDDVYRAEIPASATHVLFYSSNAIGNIPQTAGATVDQEIPAYFTSPCFYADSSDKYLYTASRREGYWHELYRVRDAEDGKKQDVVDITQEAFTPQDGALYLSSTFYDYYSDYELNGWNRDTYDVYNGGTQQNWVPFRHLNQALSDYYQSKSEAYPLYVGHFQPDTDDVDTWLRFSYIEETLDLYGFDNYNRFFSINNSILDGNGASGKYAYAVQGLVGSSLSGGALMTAGGSQSFPLFSDAFIEGVNSKNTVLGDVYANVAFPFTKEIIDNVEYWTFDSAVTTLAMQQSPDGQYYLKDVGHQDWSKNVNSGSNTSGVSTAYGFFPFNQSSTDLWANTYNYGFGAKLEFDFRLTSDGKVLDKNGNKVDITFTFSGDDDVWVFIDGNLALDVGGDHGRVEGTLNFNTLEAKVDNVKIGGSQTSQSSPKTSKFTISGSRTDEHTLTMFYIERGMWESNMRISFNFPDENELDVTKKVDVSNVDADFRGLFDKMQFDFGIQNLATHYGSKETSVETGNAGLTMQQYDIPDYGSATSGTLKNADGAVYASNKNGNGTVANGSFDLQNGETVSFRNQFRRGSYIGLKEVLTQQQAALFSTSWTMYENGAPVTAFGQDDNITNPTRQNLQNISSAVVDDGRIEHVLTGEANGHSIKNAYANATHPNGTFVFRSYADPGNVIHALEVVFTNKVNTGSLTVTKENAGYTTMAGEAFTFYVVFSNVGGMNLESSAIVKGPFTLHVGESQTISGIPLNTEYAVYEIKPDNKNITLDHITDDDRGASATYAETTYNQKSAYQATGTIDDTSNNVTFYNIEKEIATVQVTKQWVESTSIPENITVLLQRSTDQQTWSDVRSVSLTRAGNWTYTFDDLDARDDSGVLYTFRVVELDGDTVIAEGSTFTLNGADFKVTYGSLEGSSHTYTQTITNTFLPKAQVTVTKQWMVPSGVSLPGSVTVRLQRSTDGKNFTTVKDVTLNASGNWTYTFTNLDVADANGNPYTFRVVELEGGTVIAEGGTVTLGGSEFKVSYGQLTGEQGVYTQTVSNTLIPKVTLKITKLDATDTAKPLESVTFLLEKSGDSGFTPITLVTGKDGTVTCTGLKPGTYTLTETKTASGYALLKGPITLVIKEHADNGVIAYTATVDGEDATAFARSGDTYTLALTVYNRKNLEMPATGGSFGFEFWLLAGLLIMALPLMMYASLCYKKEGKYSRK